MKVLVSGRDRAVVRDATAAEAAQYEEDLVWWATEVPPPDPVEELRARVEDLEEAERTRT